LACGDFTVMENVKKGLEELFNIIKTKYNGVLGTFVYNNAANFKCGNKGYKKDSHLTEKADFDFLD